MTGRGERAVLAVQQFGGGAAAAYDMVEQLAVDGWPVLERLLDRRLMLEQVRSRDLGFVQREYFGEFFADVEALLIADQGVSGPAEG
ncbi:MAG: hypothetical protein QOH84_4234 [Kribbellaceae bacterium]|nr:hypothetical protein [Kribbellaceae bacterium]